eukprot:scaffold2165_cov294-Pinguiococcus_pyrenoidosus.AAC.8
MSCRLRGRGSRNPLPSSALLTLRLRLSDPPHVAFRLALRLLASGRLLGAGALRLAFPARAGAFPRRIRQALLHVAIDLSEAGRVDGVHVELDLAVVRLLLQAVRAHLVQLLNDVAQLLHAQVEQVVAEHDPLVCGGRRVFLRAQVGETPPLSPSLRRLSRESRFERKGPAWPHVSGARSSPPCCAYFFRLLGLRLGHGRELALELLGELLRDLVELGAVLVVRHAVAPHQANVLRALRGVAVLLVHQLLAHGAQVHGVLDDLRVVVQPHLAPVHGLREDVGLRLLVQEPRPLDILACGPRGVGADGQRRALKRRGTDGKAGDPVDTGRNRGFREFLKGKRRGCGKMAAASYWPLWGSSERTSGGCATQKPHDKVRVNIGLVSESPERH